MKGTEEPSSDGVAWVTKEVLEVGQHHSTTLIAGDSVSVHFVARSVGHDAVLLDTRALCTDPFELRLGKAFVVPELEQAVESMSPGQKARFVFRKDIMPSFSQLATVLRRTHKQAATDACGGGDPTGGHSCCAHAMKDDKETKDLRDALEFNLQVDLEIVEVKAGGTYTRDTWELTWAEKVQAVLDHKSVGNAAVGRKEYGSAATQYEQAIGLVESLRLACKTEELDLTAAGVRPALDEHVPLLLNYTLCMLKLKKYSSAVEHATTILRIDPTNVKALFRRGQSHLDRGRDIDLALADLERAHELQPDNGTIHTVLQRCQKVLATAAKQDKKQYAGMFD